MDFKERLKGCLVCGAIGDSLGGKYEGSGPHDVIDFDFDWKISDDTQLTLATCEAIYNTSKVNSEKVAKRFLEWFNKRKLSGLGSSTLMAMQGLQAGGHWALVGRSGEFAAGNGAAMRISPLAFKKNMDKLTIKDVCSITHKNDEAYVGALSIYYAIKSAIDGSWIGDMDLIGQILKKLPDTRVRDRFIELEELKNYSISEIGKKNKPQGFVVDSIPIAVFAAQKINQFDFKTIITELIKLGGDTDTICSMTGQIIGALKGPQMVPREWMEQFNDMEAKNLIEIIVSSWQG
ncbi:MAG: ADP-ribosylglycohydrolase family protein [Flammeovirgaceae bacterium]|nr:ADP-ribosylglycohydrolase family protein [Flammeovirgaceae bacterium]